MTNSTAPVIIKERNDGQLFDTKRNTYTGLDRLGSLLKQGEVFTVINERNGEDLTYRVLAEIKFREGITHYMRRLIREGKLPHDLLDHHLFREKFEPIGPHEIILPGSDYVPVDSIATPEGIPETLAKKDYSAERVAELFQRWKDKVQEKKQVKIAAGKKVNDVDLTIYNTGFPQQIDGIKCLLLSTWLEEGIKHAKIIDAIVKPLGYVKVKGEKFCYQKRLSEHESLSCGFDMAAMWRIRHLHASMGYRFGEKEVRFPLLYWGAFHWMEWEKAENMEQMMIATARIFTMAIENIGFLLATLEENCLKGGREAVREWKI